MKRWIAAGLVLTLAGCADVAPTMPQENPVPGATMSSGFGPRENDPLKGFTPGAHHDGYDLAAKDGDPIHPSRDGVVVFAGRVEGYGNAVIVKHDSTWTTLYGHAKVLKARVGERVTTKSVIALVGSTGRSTGPHLHYELRRNGLAVDPQGFTPSPSQLKTKSLPEPPALPLSRAAKRNFQKLKASSSKAARVKKSLTGQQIKMARKLRKPSPSLKVQRGKLSPKPQAKTPGHVVRRSRPIPLVRSGKPSTTR